MTIQSVAGARSGAGDINVNAPVSWGASTTLTLSAANSIMFASGAVTDPRNPNLAAQANLTATGDSAGLAMNFTNGYYPGENKMTLSGARPGVTINGVPFTVMNAHSTPILDTILRSNLAGNFVLTEDIDASGTALANNGQGWLPLGTATTPFSGQLHGFGHVISDLTINRPGTSQCGPDRLPDRHGARPGPGRSAYHRRRQYGRAGWHATLRRRQQHAHPAHLRRRWQRHAAPAASADWPALLR